MDEHNSRESEHTAKDRCEGAGTAALSQENGKGWHCARRITWMLTENGKKRTTYWVFIFIHVLSHLKSDIKTLKNNINILFSNEYQKYSEKGVE